MCVLARSLRYVRLCDTMDCSPPGSSVHGILQARILWVAVSSSKARHSHVLILRTTGKGHLHSSGIAHCSLYRARGQPPVLTHQLTHSSDECWLILGSTIDVVSGQGTAITSTPTANKHLLHIFSVQQGHSMRFQQGHWWRGTLI